MSDKAPASVKENVTPPVVEVVKNNTTQVDIILDSIKKIGEGKLSKEEFQTKFAELQEAVSKRDKDIDKQHGDFESKMETKMAEMVDKITGAFPKVPYGKSESERKYGNSMGEFLVKVRNNAKEVKDLAEGAGNTGGYLVPEEFSSEILKVELESSIVRSSGARIIPMNSATLKIPALNMASNAAGSMYGGITAYWAAENASLTESQPDFKRVTLEPKKLIGYTESSDEMVDDAIISMGNLLSDMFGGVLAFEEDAAFFTGDGRGKPLGITVAPCYVTVSRSSGSTIVTSDIVNLLSRFKGDLKRAKFVVNQSALPAIYKLMDDNDNYIWHPGTNGSIATAAPGTLYGIPIQVSEKVAAVGTTGDLLLCDFGYYLIGDRKGVSVEESMHYKFANDQKVWRIIKRVDGQPWLDSAITPRKGGSSLSPFVGIS
jgi:HK97 family phage major capsid protein